MSKQAGGYGVYNKPTGCSTSVTLATGPTDEEWSASWFWLFTPWEQDWVTHREKSLTLLVVKALVAHQTHGYLVNWTVLAVHWAKCWCTKLFHSFDSFFIYKFSSCQDCLLRILAFTVKTVVCHVTCRQLASRIRTELGPKPVPSWSCSQAVSKPLWHIPMLCVQWKIPDDGQRNCLKHVRVSFQKQNWEISASSLFYCMNLSRCTVTWTSNLSAAFRCRTGRVNYSVRISV